MFQQRNANNVLVFLNVCCKNLNFRLNFVNFITIGISLNVSFVLVSFTYS